MEIDLQFRDVQPIDLPDLTWTGGAAHQEYIAKTLERCWADEAALLVGEVNQLRLIAFGGVDFAPYPDAGKLWMLIVDDAWQGLGVGHQLIRALEQRILDYGRTIARLQVEHDNPRARGLYERLGYLPVREETDSWANDDGGITVAKVTLLEKQLSN